MYGNKFIFLEAFATNILNCILPDQCLNYSPVERDVISLNDFGRRKVLQGQSHTIRNTLIFQLENIQSSAIIVKLDA